MESGKLQILIVDDSSDKSRRVAELLGHRLVDFNPAFVIVRDYEAALSALATQFFDLVILDLLIPGADQSPSKSFSRSLINQLQEGRLVSPTVVIGLTEYESAAQDERIFYEENLFALELFDWKDDAWADRLGKRITYLVRSKRSAHNFQVNGFDLDLFVVVARHENEYKPIKKVLFGSAAEPIRHNIPNWNVEAYFGEVDCGEGKRLTCCLACVGEMGIAPTTALVTQAITMFRPKMIAMLGMCCGFDGNDSAYPQKIGNVIVVREVSSWEEGKFLPGQSSNDFRSRSKTRVISEELRRPVELAVEQSAEHIDRALANLRRKKWVKDLIKECQPLLDEEPKVRFAAIVTGSSFVANKQKISEIIAQHKTAVALDMEVYGLYTAPDFVIGSRPLCMAIKGIADFGDGADQPKVQVLASAASAIVFKEILGTIDLHALTS